jgi:AcrR family transcriptional regulator
MTLGSGRRGGRGGGGSEAARGVPVQRERIIAAMVEVVAERGYAAASVEVVTARAGVSRRTFYRCFESREACFLEIIDLGQRRTVELLLEAFDAEETWQDGLRGALASLLVWLDSEPLLTRVWLVESLAAGAWALEQRERNLQALRKLIVSSWPESEKWSSPPLAAEGVIASVLGIAHAHIVSGRPEPLIGLLGPLMGVVVRPYVSSRAAAREIKRGEELALEIQAGRHPLGVGRRGASEDAAGGPGQQHGRASDPRCSGSGVVLPAGLQNPSAHRARQCLLFLADHPGASNREVAAGVGVRHASQISRLLSGLLTQGLVGKRSEGVGRPNVWWLTPHGEQAARALRERQG